MGVKRYGLLIGVQDYKVLPPLNYCNQDALAMDTALQDYNCRFLCKVLLGETVSAFDIRREFKEMFETADNDAVLLFFFAGHATTIDGSTYFVTLDSEEDLESGVNFEWLIRTLQSLRKSQQTCIFLLDCCHAGSLPLERLPLSIDAIMDSANSSMNVALIAATEGVSTAEECHKLKQGVLTYWLFNGLLGGAVNSDGEITVSSLYEFVAKGISGSDYSQKVVHKTMMVGCPIVLGDGFQPQEQIQPSKLSDIARSEIESTTTRALENIRRGLNTNFEAWQHHAYKETSQYLSQLIEWRIGLEAKHSELRTDLSFQRFDNEILSCQGRLTNLQQGMHIHGGSVEYKLGEGGFGAVYAVKTAKTIRAYKVYHATQLHERDKVKAFLRGYRAMKSLDHPNIVKVHEETNAPLGFYMDFIAGQNFRNWWTDDPQKLLTILHMIAQTIEYAHSKGVVHRDIKPENIIIDDSDIEHPLPYLTDFDLAWYSMATVYSSLSNNAAAAFGHYLYAAPEQYESPGDEITKKPASDIYGFGQLCYFTIIGKDPVTDKQMSIAALKDRLENWQHADAAEKFVKLYETCTKRKPSERYKSMSEAISALLEIRNLLIDPERARFDSNEQFVKELIFSIFGFEKSPLRGFPSRSQRTHVELESISPEKINVRFDTVQGFVGMTGSFDQQRNAVSKRIQNRFSDINNNYKLLNPIAYKQVNGDVYSVNVTIPGNQLNFSGVNLVRNVILETINCIES